MLRSDNPSQIVEKIKQHIKHVLESSNHKRVIIAVSGGIDSATSLNLLSRVLDKRNIIVVHLYYFEKSIGMFEKTIAPLDLPDENILLSPIKEVVDVIARNVGIEKGSLDAARDDRIRLGNIMARIRMIYLFDQAKKLNALVCGTENRTEHHLGYFTRFGDAASDFEVINHLYKTEVRSLAKELQVPKDVIGAPPSAGLWDGQTDEKELGCAYDEIDAVLRLHFDEKLSREEIEKHGHKNVQKILQIVEKNRFKHVVPYLMK